MKVDDKIVAFNKYFCDEKASMKEKFKLPTISKLFDLTSLAGQMRQKIEPKGEFGLDSSILLDGRTRSRTVLLGDLFTSLATGFQVSPAVDKDINNMLNGLKDAEKNSEIPVSKKFTKLFLSKNGQNYALDANIEKEELKTFSTLTSADHFRKIIQNEFVCNEVCGLIINVIHYV